MADVLLSQSLVESSNASSMRDPFQQARNSYESRIQDSSVLSESPFQMGDQNLTQGIKAQTLGDNLGNDFDSAMKSLGVPSNGISFNGIGRTQLIGRLRSKFGDQYSENKGVSQALKFFEDNMSLNDNQQKQMNESLANANRTIGAIFGG